MPNSQTSVVQRAGWSEFALRIVDVIQAVYGGEDPAELRGPRRRPTSKSYGCQLIGFVPGRQYIAVRGQLAFRL